MTRCAASTLYSVVNLLRVGDMGTSFREPHARIVDVHNWWGTSVITAVLDAGLVLELFHEQSYTNVPWPWTGKGKDGFYRLPQGGSRYPLTYRYGLGSQDDSGVRFPA